MDNIVFLFLRRMRQPLLTLIAVYTVAVVGLTLIPGQDETGHVHYLSIFHAFYFVSFMSTTIGFGEIPYAFTDAQRLWVILTLYASVVSWIYALGTVLSLLQNQVFQQALTERAFARRVRGLREPFYLVCGYGETGQALVRALTDRGQHVVVIDHDQMRTSMIHLQNLRDHVPALSADVRQPRYLQLAGLPHPACAGVVAVTDDNDTNLKVAITSKLLHSDIKVICRVDSRDVEANLASFGTDHIIDPFDTFSQHLAIAFQAPCLYLLQRWLGGEEDAQPDEPVHPPHQGRWVVCGYGRFGKAMVRRLRKEGLEVTVIEARPDWTGQPPEGHVAGVGTEADTLLQAGIEGAAGLIAGTDNDTNNLSIVMTARDLNPDLFVVLRQNQSQNRAIIEAVKADMVMHPSAIIAERIRVLLGTPMLYRFASLALHQDGAWACELVSRVAALINQAVPDVRELRIELERPQADRDRAGGRVDMTLAEALSDPWHDGFALPCIVLLIRRGGEYLLLPDASTLLRPGDELLLCGERRAFNRLRWNLCNASALCLVRDEGHDYSHSWLWRRLAVRFRLR